VVALLGALVVSAVAPRRYRAASLVWAEWAGQADMGSARFAAELAGRRVQSVRQRVLNHAAAERERTGARSAKVSVRPGEASAFSIECVDADPSKAALLSNRLVSLLVEEAERERALDPLALKGRLAGARQAMEEKAAAFARYRAEMRDASKPDLQLKGLARDYDQARKAYLEVEEQWRAAEAASRLGQGGRARFTLLRRASPPHAPSFPNPVLFALVGAALGLAVGLEWAFLAELRDRSIKGPEDLGEVLPHALLAEIPLVPVRRFGRRVPARRGSRSP
jgi:hypothetical protein